MPPAVKSASSPADSPTNSHTASPADGRAIRWQTHRTERREALVAAAIRAIDAEGPDATLAEIATVAGVSKTVLYRYFADKDSLLAAVADWATAEVIAAIAAPILRVAPIQERVSAAVEGYLRTIDAHPNVYLLLFHHRATNVDVLAAGKSSVAESLAALVAQALQTLQIDDRGAQPWAQALVGLGLSTGEWWLDNRSLGRAQLAEYITQFIWHAFAGIAADHGVDLRQLDQDALDEGRR